MLGPERRGASPCSCAQTSLDAVALGGIADLLGHGQADARVRLVGGDRLQRKCAAARPHALSRIEELRPLGEATERSVAVGRGRHAAWSLSRETLAADLAAQVQDLAAMPVGHAGPEAV